MCAGGSTIGGMRWHVYSATGCNLLRDCYLGLSHPIQGPVLVGVMERRCASRIVGTCAVHTVPFMCVLKLAEMAPDRCLVHIPVSYDTLQACHKFRFQEEPVFRFVSRAMILNPESGLWVVAYSECVSWLCAAVLMARYAKYRLW